MNYRKKIWLRVKETKRRFGLTGVFFGALILLMVAFIVSFVFVPALLFNWQDLDLARQNTETDLSVLFATLRTNLQDPTVLIQISISILSCLALLWAGALSVTRFLFWDSVIGAKIFERSNQQPMDEVAKDFEWLVEYQKKQVVFLIDDLDRCSYDYVVELLDAVQNLIRSPRRPEKEDTKQEESKDKKPSVYFVVAVDTSKLRKSLRGLRRCFRRTRASPWLSLSRQAISTHSTGSTVKPTMERNVS
jgi:hypothetical protein